MFLKLRNNHRKTSASESLFNKVTGLKACVFIKKDTPTQMFSYEYWKMVTDIRYLMVIFCYSKIRPHSRRNFTTERLKFLVKICFFLKQDFNSPSKIFLLFNHFVFTKICKALKLQRETSGSNSTILISNFSKYI